MLALLRVCAILVIGLGMLLFHVVAIVLGCAVYLYFLPGIIAMKRDYPATGRVFVACALTGWTVVGWICLLGFALAIPHCAGSIADEYPASHSR